MGFAPLLLNKNKDVSNKIFRTELSYCRKTHQAERYETPQFFIQLYLIIVLNINIL